MERGILQICRKFPGSGHSPTSYWLPAPSIMWLGRKHFQSISLKVVACLISSVNLTCSPSIDLWLSVSNPPCTQHLTIYFRYLSLPKLSSPNAIQSCNTKVIESPPGPNAEIVITVLLLPGMCQWANWGIIFHLCEINRNPVKQISKVQYQGNIHKGGTSRKFYYNVRSISYWKIFNQVR